MVSGLGLISWRLLLLFSFSLGFGLDVESGVEVYDVENESLLFIKEYDVLWVGA